MIKLTICKGFLVITDGNGQIYPGWIGDNPPSYPELPEVETVYQRCVSRGYSPERTIDVLLYIFHRQRIIRSGFLADIPLVIGLVGGAGGGKSCGGAAIAIFDYLLAGIPLISNMDVEVTVRYRQASKVFKSESLDKSSVFNIKDLEQMYRNACLFVDEANIEFSEARRSMSNRNLIFSYVLQERRKRMLNVIHTEQSEMWGDDRLRFSTSLFIKTKDAAYNDGLPQPGDLGRKSNWKIYDTAGVINGEVVDDRDPRFVVYKGDFHNTPFWHSYDSYQLQGLEDNSAEKSDIKIKNGEVLGKLKDKYAEGRALVNDIIAKGHTELESSQIWEAIGVTDRSTMTRLGIQLDGLGIPVIKRGKKKIYLFGESKFSDNGG